MTKYILKRLALTIPVLLGSIFLVYAIMSLTPGDPGTLILGMTADKNDIIQLNTELGYYQPLIVRFLHYVKDIVLHFDFGLSYRTQTPVFTEILSKFPKTLILAVCSMALSSIIGITLGIISAVKQYSYIDNIFTVMAMFFAAIPGFWFGLTLMLIFSLKLGWLPSNGVDSWKSFILPTVTLSVGSAASLLRLTRSTMLETIRQDYIRTARAKGAGEKRIILHHALKNALLPVITTLGMNFGASLGGAIIIETVFGMPGLGTHIVSAIRQKDIPVVLASTLLLAFLFSIIMLIIDILYAFIDPRIKSKYAK